jgi:hypothetical protein
MDQTATDVGEEAEKPEHEQDNNYSPEHGVPFDLLNWPLLRHNVVIRSSKRSTTKPTGCFGFSDVSRSAVLFLPKSESAFQLFRFQGFSFPRDV